MQNLISIVLTISHSVTLHQGRQVGFWIISIVLMLCQAVTGSHVFKSPLHKYSLGDRWAEKNDSHLRASISSWSRLFMTPLYEGACIVQSLIYGRRGFDERDSGEYFSITYYSALKQMRGFFSSWRRNSWQTNSNDLHVCHDVARKRRRNATIIGLHLPVRKLVLNILIHKFHSFKREAYLDILSG